MSVVRFAITLIAVCASATREASVPTRTWIPNDEFRNCTTTVESLPPKPAKIYGVNLGGWMVLEPWVTPSLFYQFLGQDKDSVAMDSFSFCRVLGPQEGNKQLQRHWGTWLVEDHIAQLADLGINALRLPVGDWMFEPYGPFEGCTRGALERVDDLLAWAEKYNMSVLIDMHAWRGSANGLDNGGSTVGLKWTSTLQDVAPGAQTFEHWPRRTAQWLGVFDVDNSTYTIDWDNIERSLRILEMVAKRYSASKSVWALEPVNEPWQFTPLDILKEYYWRGFKRVKAIAPHWKFVIHDSFRFSVDIWGDFMQGCPDVVLDTHIYQAWFEPSARYNFYTNACGQKNLIQQMQRHHPVIVGEWSLATDNCAMWLNGFNDNLPGYPKLPCKYVPCPDPYMGADQNGAPPSAVKGLQGPFGTGVSGPLYGLCPKSRDWPRHSISDDTGVESAPIPQVRDLYACTLPEDDDTNTVMATLAAKKLSAFALEAYGSFFWNFRTEFEDQWSYLRAVERNWILKDAAAVSILNVACQSEDSHCLANPDATDDTIRAAMAYVVGYDKYAMAEWIAEDSESLRRRADMLFEQYWMEKRSEITNTNPRNKVCDLGGAAKLTNSVYKCVARRVDEEATLEGMKYCVGYDPDAVASFEKLSGDTLWQKADEVFDAFWEMHRYAGVTCDFGGGAYLIVDRDIMRQDEIFITSTISKFNNVELETSGAFDAKSTPTSIPHFFINSYTRLVAWTFMVVGITFLVTVSARKPSTPHRLLANGRWRATYQELRPLSVAKVYSNERDA